MISSSAINLLFAISPYLTSSNAAVLCLLPDSAEQVSYAETFARKDNGAWVDYSSSDDDFTWGAQAASVCRIGTRWVMDGRMAYVNFTGHNMCGSAWIDPDDRPFDIVEGSENAGTKKLERYFLSGGLSGSLGQIALGARMNLSAANYVKQKDLRHQNKLLNLNVTAGLLWRANDVWSVGADFYYRRIVEELNFKTFGTTDRQYSSLIDYGTAFGVTEYSTSNGLIEENQSRPWVESSYGFGVQLNMKTDGGLTWYSDGHLDWASGLYGKQSLYTPVFMENEGLNWSARTQLDYGRHTLSLQLQGYRMENDRNLFQYTNQGNGIKEYSYHGKLQTSRREKVSASLSYCIDLDRWQLKATAQYDNRKLIASYYPNYRQQNLHTESIRIEGTRRWVHDVHDWGLTLRGGYSDGGGERADDGIYAGGSTLQTSNLTTWQGLLDKRADYMTCRQGQAGLSIGYGQKLLANRLRLYVTLDANWQKGWETTYDWDNTHRQSYELRIGCTF